MESRVAVVLTSGVWTHGMLYVALGRVTDPDNLRVVAPKAPGDVIIITLLSIYPYSSRSVLPAYYA